MANTFVIGDYVQLTVYSLCNNQVGINDYWFEVTAAGVSPATDADFATYMATVGSIPTLYKAVQSLDSQYYGLGVRIRRAGSPTFPMSTNITGQGVGTASGTNLPTQTTGILSFQTEFVGRAYRGRAYIPFPASGFITGAGLPTAAYVAAVNAIGASVVALQTPSAGGRTASLNSVLWHRRRAGPPVVPESVTFVTSYTAKTLWATQRRRGDYGRLNAPPF